MLPYVIFGRSYMTESNTAQWELFAARSAMGFSSIRREKRIVRYYGYSDDQIITVRAIEDADGEYRGWIPTGEDFPDLIARKHIFPAQFTYGPVQSEADGKGRIVHLRIEEISTKIA